MSPGQRSARMVLILAFLLTLFPVLVSARSQTPVASLEVTTTVAIDFPVGMTFSASIALPNEQPATRVELYYHPVSEETLRLGVADLETSLWPDVAVSVDLQSDFLPSGIDLAYFWRVTMSDGSRLDSQPETTSWIDTRFTWKTFETSQIQLHTYSLTDEFAQSVADAAQASITSLEERFGLVQRQPISIWLYASTTDFRSALQTNSREAVAGASYPGYYVVHVVLLEGDDREVGRTITHEVSHQVLYEATINPYSNPPLWFDEGMATHSQTSGAESYLPLAISSAKWGGVFALESLTVEFPFKPSDAAVAYAVSWSAVEYIMETWGDQGISELIAQYQTGIPSADALQNALGVTSDQLDTDLQYWLLSHA